MTRRGDDEDGARFCGREEDPGEGMDRTIYWDWNWTCSPPWIHPSATYSDFIYFPTHNIRQAAITRRNARATTDTSSCPQASVTLPPLASSVPSQLSRSLSLSSHGNGNGGPQQALRARRRCARLLTRAGLPLRRRRRPEQLHLHVQLRRLAH